MRTVLVIDDNPAVGTALELVFSLREIRTLVAHAPAEGLAVLAREDVDLVVQDMNFTRRHDLGRGGRRAVPRDPRAASGSADRIC